MLALINRVFKKSNDPINSCDVYLDKKSGSCAHVDGLLCNFPDCEILTKYHNLGEGTMIANEVEVSLGQLIHEGHNKKYPIPD